MRPVVMAAIAQRQMPVESDLPSANGQFACLARRSGCACACYVLRLDFAAPGIPHTQGSPHAGSLPVTAPVLPFANRGKGSGGTFCFLRLGLVGARARAAATRHTLGLLCFVAGTALHPIRERSATHRPHTF